MYEILFIFVVIFTAVYMCLRKRRRLLEAQRQVRPQQSVHEVNMRMYIVCLPMRIRHLQDFHQVLHPIGPMHLISTMQEAQANSGDGLVAVRINNDWYLFSRAAAPLGHEQVG